MPPSPGTGHVSQAKMNIRSPSPVRKDPAQGSSEGSSLRVSFNEKSLAQNQKESEQRKSALKQNLAKPKADVLVVEDEKEQRISSSPEKQGPERGDEDPRREVNLKSQESKGKGKGNRRWASWPKKGKGRKGKGRGKPWSEKGQG